MPIQIKNLSKAYDGRPVLENFSLALPERGTVCLLGPSGSGKTTLLHLMAGLIKPESGTVSGLKHKKISFIFQEDRLLPWLTAEENVAVVMDKRYSAGCSPSRWLEKLGLAGEEHKRPAELSGGMRRRVAIARALAFSGDVLLMDEPFKGLDAQTRSLVMEVIRQETQGALNILVTHQEEAAAMLSDVVFRFTGPPLAFLPR